MNAEHLLDAMGLLDDDLIQEAEAYRRPQSRRNSGIWLGWAASFAVVLALGYGITHFGVEGGNSTAPAGGSMGSTPAASAPAEDSAPDIDGAEAQEPCDQPSSSPGDGGCDHFDTAVENFGMESGQTPAIMVDGTVYWYQSETAVVRPDGLEVRESTSYTQGTPEEDGQINFPKEGVRYVVLEEGRVGVNWNSSYEWKIFVPVPPEEP